MLEKTLRNAMDEISRRVLSTFDSFTDEQNKKQELFSASLKSDSDRLEQELELLEQKIEELKSSTIGSMKERMQGFEADFDRDLKTRGDKINEDFLSWKSSLDGKMTAIANEFIDERRALEKEYNENLHEKITALQKKNEEQQNRIENQIVQVQGAIQNQISDIKASVAAFTADIQEKIDETDSRTDESLKSTAEKSQRAVEQQLEKVKADILADLQLFEENMQSRQETGTSSIDAALGEFNTWKQQLKHQLDESKGLFEQELSGLKEVAVNKVNDAQSYLDNEYQQFVAQAQKKVSELDGHADDSLNRYEVRSKEIVQQLQQMYEQMLKDTEERVRMQNADASRKLQELNTEIQEVSEKNRNEQSAFVMKMQGDSNAMQTQMSELSKELQAIKTQMSVYEKAEQMKKQLDEKIGMLEDDFTRLDKFKGVALDLTGQYNQILRIKDEVEKQTEKFEEDKNHIDSIGQKYEKLITLSSSIDDKINGLNTTYDALQNMEIHVRDFQESLATISGRYDRLEQKQEVIDRVMKDVDSSFENLKNLEDRLKVCSRQAETLPDEIRDVQRNVDELLKNSPKIGEATERLTSLQELMKEAEKRMEEINSTRQGIGRSEQRLQELSNSIDSKMKMLELLTRKDVAANPPSGNSQLTPSEREHIRSLRRQGWSVRELANRLGRTVTEIELILDTPPEPSDM